MNRIQWFLPAFSFAIVVSAFVMLLPQKQNQYALDLEQVSPKDKVVIRFSYVTGEDTPKGLAAERFAQEMKTRSQGRVEVQVFPNSTLYSDGEELEKLQSNTIQMIAPATSKLSDRIPELGLFDLPFLFQKPEDVWKVIDSSTGKQIFQGIENQGFVPLTMWDNGFKEITNDKHPIVYPADFQGLTFRIMQGGQVLQRQFTSVGAKSIPLSFNELYQTLSLHEVNGEENTFSNISNKRLYQVQKYVTLSNHGYLGYVVLTNPKFWNSLSPELRKMVQSTLVDVTTWERQQAIAVNQKKQEELLTNPNLRVTKLTAEEVRQWKKAFAPAYEWFQERTGDQLLGEVRGIAPD